MTASGWKWWKDCPEKKTSWSWARAGCPTGRPFKPRRTIFRLASRPGKKCNPTLYNGTAQKACRGRQLMRQTFIGILALALIANCLQVALAETGEMMSPVEGAASRLVVKPAG